MSLNEKQWQASLDLIGSLHHKLNSYDSRLKTGQKLLQLLNADHFASYLWNGSKQCFEQPCYINLDADNLQRYEQHYQFCDPITPILQRSKTALSVNQVMPQKALERTEFYNDFLAKDGMHYGINLHVFDHDKSNLGDFRIWRRQGQSNFDSDDLKLLDIIAPHFQQALLNCRQHEQPYKTLTDIEQYQLTQRELGIVEALWQGGEQQLNDQQVAQQLNISIATLRTHIRHIYDKCQVKNRSALWSKLIH